ncbi:MAG: ascorbate transporter subunit [Enterobacter kobei]|nr:ascorbate transporter subunit [Enterobacter kobei]
MFILETLNFIVDILKVPSVLVGLIALIGLVAQKKSFSDVVKGTVKTILGFIVLGGGATVLVGSLNPLGGMFEHAFNIQGIIPNNEAIVSIALEKYGASTALIMAFGMVANIIVARFTRLKYIFLTGHHTFYMACMIGVILTVAGFEGVGLVFTGSLILGLVMAFFPAIAQRYMRRITGTDDIGFGHFGTLGYVLAGWIGSVCGKGSRSTEEMNLPKNLSFLRDSSISISLTMIIIYLIMAVCAGREYIESTLSGGQNFLVYAIIQAITFAAGVFIILQGVRLILAEIVPAFTGFSEKLVPNARPALDCPVVYPYAPNAVLIGFLFSFLGGLVGLFLLGQMKLVLILPGVVPHFFTGATASDADFGVIGIVLGNLARYLSPLAITGLVVALFAALVAWNVFARKKPAAGDTQPTSGAKL